MFDESLVIVDVIRTHDYPDEVMKEIIEMISDDEELTEYLISALMGEETLLNAIRERLGCSEESAYIDDFDMY